MEGDKEEVGEGRFTRVVVVWVYLELGQLSLSEFEDVGGDWGRV